MSQAQPKTDFCVLSVRGAVLVVELNRVKNLNALHPPASQELSRVWDWFDAHPDLRVAIVRCFWLQRCAVTRSRLSAFFRPAFCLLIAF